MSRSPAKVTGPIKDNRPAASGDQYYIKNEFKTETWMSAPELLQLKQHAPEAYELYLEEIRKNGDANRSFQERAQTLDEETIPKLVNNDRWGLGISTVLVVGSLALSGYCALNGLSFWWVPLTLNALTPLVAALRGRKGKPA